MIHQGKGCCLILPPADESGVRSDTSKAGATEAEA